MTWRQCCDGAVELCICPTGCWTNYGLEQAWAKFPEVKGFSTRNLELNRAWARFWSERAIAKQPVSQSAQIPLGHNRVIVRNCQTSAEALYYLQ